MPLPEHRVTRRHLLAGTVAAAVPLAAGTSAPARATGRPHRRAPSLDLDPRSYLELDADFLDTPTAHYPRIKKMRDGRYILFYQSSQHSWSVYWTVSRDLRHWATPQLLFATHKILDGADDRCYATSE